MVGAGCGDVFVWGGNIAGCVRSLREREDNDDEDKELEEKVTEVRMIGHASDLVRLTD